jgi:hypothetical protein
MIGAGAFLDLLRANWKAVLAGLALAALGLALILAKADARHWKKRYASEQLAHQLEQAKHSVTLASLDRALVAIEDQNAAVARLKTDGDKRASDAKSALEASERAAERSKGIVRQLEASAAAVPAGEPCTPSDTFWNTRGEL